LFVFCLFFFVSDFDLGENTLDFDDCCDNSLAEAVHSYMADLNCGAFYQWNGHRKCVVGLTTVDFAILAYVDVSVSALSSGFLSAVIAVAAYDYCYFHWRRPRNCSEPHPMAWGASLLEPSSW
jgi:hypothetical protein